jgi:hypothetical protein
MRKHVESERQGLGNPNTDPVVAVIDLSLASSYAPGIICVGKTVVMFAVNYFLASVMWMSLTDRCVVLSILLYLDRAHHQEYIIDTNACVAIAFFGLVVNELRGGTLGHGGNWPHEYTYVCSSVWAAYSLLVLCVGEVLIDDTIRARTRAVSGLFASLVSRVYRQAHGVLFGVGNSSSNSNTNGPLLEPGAGSLPYDKLEGGKKGVDNTPLFIPLLITTVCLYAVCNVQLVWDIDYNLETALRVFCFVSSSLLWLYTMNVQQMQRRRIASFTPCVNRFAVLLMCAPLLLTVLLYVVTISIILFRGWEMLSSVVGASSSSRRGAGEPAVSCEGGATGGVVVGTGTVRKNPGGAPAPRSRPVPQRTHATVAAPMGVGGALVSYPALDGYSTIGGEFQESVCSGSNDAGGAVAGDDHEGVGGGGGGGGSFGGDAAAFDPEAAFMELTKRGGYAI